MHYLVATDSVHATAAACDYLETRLSPGDTVTVAALDGPASRDAGDATNVATARLLGRADVESQRLDGEQPVDALLDLLTGPDDVDVLVVDPSVGAEPGDGVSDTVIATVGRAPVPVVVVPGSRDA